LVTSSRPTEVGNKKIGLPRVGLTVGKKRKKGKPKRKTGAMVIGYTNTSVGGQGKQCQTAILNTWVWLKRERGREK